MGNKKILILTQFYRKILQQSPQVNFFVVWALLEIYLFSNKQSYKNVEINVKFNCQLLQQSPFVLKRQVGNFNLDSMIFKNFLQQSPLFL